MDSGVAATIEFYKQEGWKIEDRGDNVFDRYSIFSPTGTVFESYGLERNHCPFCEEEDEPAGEGQFECFHSKELIAEEMNAKNLLNFLRLKEGQLCRCFLR